MVEFLAGLAVGLAILGWVKRDRVAESLLGVV